MTIVVLYFWLFRDCDITWRMLQKVSAWKNYIKIW